ncbi:integrase core domain-containing protein [Streptomyces koyangensis]
MHRLSTRLLIVWLANDSDFAARLGNRSAGVRQSTSAVGCSAGNVLSASFNATFRRETPQGRGSWPTKREARLGALRRLHRRNTRRRHSRLGRRSPMAFENALNRTAATPAQAA